MRCLLSLAFLFLSCTHLQAGLIFTIAPRTLGAIPLGDSAIFDVSVHTDAATGTIPDFGGLTFFLSADDPNTEGGKSTGGRLVFGTADPADPIASGRVYLFLPSEGAFANAGDSFMVYSASGNNRSLGTTGGLLGSFLLDTTGATAGNHLLQFSQLHAIDASANTLPGPFTGNSFSYVVGVPEPSSLIYILSLLSVASSRAIAARKLFRHSRVGN